MTEFANQNLSRRASPKGGGNRGDRIRTCDLLVPNQALYQAKLHPVTRLSLYHAVTTRACGIYDSGERLAAVTASGEIPAFVYARYETILSK